MLVEARTQFTGIGLTCSISRGDGDIDRRQGVLIQTKGLACEALDAIACDCRAEGSCRYAQTQSRIGFMIGKDQQTEKCIGKLSAAPLHFAKFGRLMQTLARLERQFTDR